MKRFIFVFFPIKLGPLTLADVFRALIWATGIPS
jgi:hypothetical protein